jgi:hypothetical protein
MNVLGHSVLMDELLKGDALVEHATIVFAGSEVANGFGGMPAPKYQSMDAKSIEPFIDGRGFNQSGSALVDRAYSYSKNIQVLYVGALARKHPQHYMVVASPGGTAGTSIMQHARCCSVMGFARCCVPCMQWCGVMHSTQVGAERYLQAAYDPEYRKKFSSGTFTASKKGKLVGEVVDQSTILSMYSEPAYQDAVWEAVHVKHLNE